MFLQHWSKWKTLAGISVQFGYSTVWKVCEWGEGKREKEVLSKELENNMTFMEKLKELGWFSLKREA